MLRDKSEIRRRLSRNRHWALYALADLDDELFAECDWRAGAHDSLALVFRGMAIQPIFVTGNSGDVRELLLDLGVARGYLNLCEHQVHVADGIYVYRERHTMRRMFIDDGAGLAAATAREDVVVSLGPADEAEVRGLYALGDGAGIGFAPFQLATGAFCGVRAPGGQLIAVAGVHVLSIAEGVAGVGNVFTHPSHRNRGYAQVVTSAVVRGIRSRGVETIGLNVETSNAPAIRAYERIGFVAAFDYVEGAADRVESPGHHGVA